MLYLKIYKMSPSLVVQVNIGFNDFRPFITWESQQQEREAVSHQTVEW